ncbi:MAG: helix-turn-helix transcriptional regulator [Acidobacteriaceae bacterium]
MPRKKSVEDLAFDVEVGARIERARLSKRLTQRAMARRLKISVNQYYWYEVGRNSCPLSVLVRIAAVLEVPEERLIPKYKL